MKIKVLLSRFCALAVILVAATAHASERYITLAYPNDSVNLASNETAFVVSASPISPEHNWQAIEYQRGTNSFVSITLPLSGSLSTLPLAGPGVVRLSDPSPVGVVGLKIVRGATLGAHGLERYFTFAYPGDSLRLAPNETALVVGTAVISLDTPSWTSIQYQRGMNSLVSIALPLQDQLNGQLPLTGPGVVAVNPNMDGLITGPGIVGLMIVKRPMLFERCL
jgi:hypothetical protein